MHRNTYDEIEHAPDSHRATHTGMTRWLSGAGGNMRDSTPTSGTGQVMIFEKKI